MVEPEDGLSVIAAGWCARSRGSVGWRTGCPTLRAPTEGTDWWIWEVICRFRRLFGAFGRGKARSGTAVGERLGRENRLPRRHRVRDAGR